MNLIENMIYRQRTIKESTTDSEFVVKIQSGTLKATDGQGYYFVYPERYNPNIIPKKIWDALFVTDTGSVRFPSHKEAEEWVKDNIEDPYNIKVKIESLTEDTVKKSNGKWTNRGDTGKEHGEFKTKKQADAQRKAMYANGYKGESLSEDLKVNDTYDRYCDDCDRVTSQKFKGIRDYNGRYAPEEMFICTDCGSENYFKVDDLDESLPADKVKDYQEWVDYDMKHYGKISDQTMKEIKEAGFTVVKDKYGDYEVVVHEESLKESIDPSNAQVKQISFDIVVPGDEIIKQGPGSKFFNSLINACEDNGYAMASDSYGWEVEDITDYYNQGMIEDLLDDYAEESLKESVDNDDPLDMALMSFESGHRFERDDFESDDEFVEYDSYMSLGPAGFYDEFKDELDFTQDFIDEYGDKDEKLEEAFNSEYGVDLQGYRPFGKSDWFNYQFKKDIKIEDGKYLDPLIFEADDFWVVISGDYRDSSKVNLEVEKYNQEKDDSDYIANKAFDSLEDAIQEGRRLVRADLNGVINTKSLVNQGYEVTYEADNPRF